jgi:uncharacterized alpha-E superfamily protein
MLSRVADSLYWMSRYLERAENTVRQLDVTMSLMLDSSETSADTRWQRMLHFARQSLGIEWTGDADAMTRSLVFDSQPGLVSPAFTRARECAAGARRNLDRAVAAAQPALPPDALAARAGQFRSNMNDFLASVVDGIHLFKGVSDTTMIHGEGWQFIRLGRYLERAYATATLLEVYQRACLNLPEREHSGYQYLELVGLLRCCTSFEAYCQVYTADLSPETASSSFSCSIAIFLTPALLDRRRPAALDSIQRTGGRRPPDELLATAGRCTPCCATPPSTRFSTGDPAPFCTPYASSACRFTN